MKTLPRKQLVQAAVVIMLGVLPTAGRATVITQDSFQYTGPLVGQGGWQAHSAGGSKPIIAYGGSIRVDQGAGSGEDVNKRWFTPVNGGKTYASFNLVVPAGATLAAADYFAHFRPAAPDTLGFKARIHVGPPASSTQYTLGISTTSSGTSPIVNYPVQLDYGRYYKVVAAYDSATGTSTLWVNPVTESSTNVTSTHASAVGSRIESFAFRQSSVTTSVQEVYDLVVGTTFADVVVVKNLPSMEHWGMIVLSLLLLAGGIAVVTRRREYAA